MSINDLVRHPALACRIVRLIPAEYELRDLPLKQLPSTTFVEYAHARLDTGEEIEIFNPFDGALELKWVGRRCLLELAAFLGDCELLGDSTPQESMGARDREIIGRVVSYYCDGVLIDTGIGSVGVLDQPDDRLEPGRVVRVSDHRLDFMRLIAFESDDSPGSWIECAKDPFADLPGALLALRSGEIRTDSIPGTNLDKDLKVVEEFESPRITLWGQSVVHLVYRLGAAGLKEAEPDVAAFLGSGDVDARRAAIWVLSRYWCLPAYRDNLAAIAMQDAVANVRTVALVGLGILLRGTGDHAATQLFGSTLRDTTAYWITREAAYLALLGVWLPRTAAVRESWRGWRVSKSRARTTWDKAWAHRVDWDLVSRLERGSI